ncbi:hypothetical protein ABK040_007918 [Willaertia magna]
MPGYNFNKDINGLLSDDEEEEENQYNLNEPIDLSDTAGLLDEETNIGENYRKKNSSLFQFNRNICLGIFCLSCVFIFSTIILFGYRVLNVRGSSKVDTYIFSLYWTPTSCFKTEASSDCLIITESRFDENQFIISDLRPKTSFNCERIDQKSFPSELSSEFSELRRKYDKVWPPYGLKSATLDWKSAYEKHGMCLEANGTNTKQLSDFLHLSNNLFLTWSPIITSIIADKSNITSIEDFVLLSDSKSEIKLPTYITPQCIVLDNKQLFASVDICLSKDTFSPQTGCIASTCQLNEPIFIKTIL